MYNLTAVLNYSDILNEYMRLYEILSHKYKLLDNKKKSEAEKKIENISTETTKVASKKRVPNTLASQCDIGYTTTSENDGRQYIIKLVKGSGNKEYKRWIIV